MKVVIPSKGRASTIKDRSLKFFPDAVVTVDEEDLDDYRSKGIENLLPHPKLGSLAEIRNWILSTIPDDLFMPDDDLCQVYSVVGRNNRRYNDPDDIMQIVENAAFITRQIGAGYFGFSNSPDPKTFKPFDPINFSGWVGSQVGHIGRRLHYDNRLSLYDDCDFSLENLLRLRIVFIDTRFVFQCYKTLRQPGGNTRFRSSERSANETEYLQQKWGRWVGIGKLGNPFITPSTVKRRQ